MVATAFAVLWCLLARTHAIGFLENGTYDLRVKLAADKQQADKRIVILDVDNATFDDLKEKLGRWPWSRRVWTELIRYVDRGKPAAIGIDAIFSGEESPAVDSDFAAVMQRSGRVVLAYSVSPAELEYADEAPIKAKIAELQKQGIPAPPNAVGDRLELKKSAINTPLPMLAQSAAGLGNVLVTTDSDGTNRRVALSFAMEGNVYSTLAARTTEVALQSRMLPFQEDGRSALAASGAIVPVDSSGHMLLRWHGGSFTYERIPVWQMICSIYPTQCPDEKVYFTPDYFRDKIIIIGASAAGSGEARTTPFSDVAPGFMIHAAAIDNLLHRDSIREAPSWLLYSTIVPFCFAGAGLLVARHPLWQSAAAVFGLMGVYVLAGYLFYARSQWWVPMAAPVLALVTSAVGSAALQYATTGRELRRTRGTLDRYMSPQLVNYVLENVNLAGEKRELTVFFSDVRNFTTLTEGSDPMELISLLNEYLSAMTEIVFKYEGIVDKFIGDGILAYWGAFTPGQNHAVQGAKASIEMMTRLQELNKKWAAEGRSELDIGIGLNTGVVVFGNVGSGKKIEFTVIGDAVNLAARLESTNKEYGTHIIISDATCERLGPTAEVRKLGGVKVKGKTVETQILELLAMDGVRNPKTSDPSVMSAKH